MSFILSIFAPSIHYHERHPKWTNIKSRVVAACTSSVTKSFKRWSTRVTKPIQTSHPPKLSAIIQDVYSKNNIHIVMKHLPEQTHIHGIHKFVIKLDERITLSKEIINLHVYTVNDNKGKALILRDFTRFVIKHDEQITFQKKECIFMTTRGKTHPWL